MKRSFVNLSWSVAALVSSSQTSNGAFLCNSFCGPSKRLLFQKSIFASPSDFPDTTSESNTEEALQRTASYLRKFQQLQTSRTGSGGADDISLNEQREVLYRQYAARSANSLKDELKNRKLPTTGRKPALARRLADYDLQVKYGMTISDEEYEVSLEDATFQPPADQSLQRRISTFAGITLSDAAGCALGNAGFETPSPIQAAAIPRLVRGESLILQAETGSGKTLAYLLPVTEQLWKNKGRNDDSGFVVILTPTRELATQVAGVAAALAPKGSVRLVTHPSNLMPKFTSRDSPVLFVGSSKCVMQSLYGDGIMPASPTPKPLAVQFLKNTRCLILDEVDRILNVKGNEKTLHEKPAAIVTAATMRQTVGRVQIVAASATVGRPLRRELARVLGLSPQECPKVVLSTASRRDSNEPDTPGHVPRAITLPTTVENYIVSVDDTHAGKLLTTAFSVIQKLTSVKPRRMLLVLSKGFGINVQNSIGALKHFQCNPEPKSLLDVLQADNSESLIQTYSAVSGAMGVGESLRRSESEAETTEGYLLVTGEDSVRGLHFDGLDVVIVVGRPNGPDEYLHIAGRTGRAGRSGKVVNVVSDDNAGFLKSWEKMLDVDFKRIQLDDLTQLD